ncbi:hypothetical protein HRR99_03270 [Agrobacterium vaccinii]|uniref:hypothetical protein n=1 Tax=Agrobacterium vaccinii TaxID=2735528 RepID=UPI001E53C13F|nr:hypothetical protein [Agrobacterium vaccinii]UHS60606.1 hypothetical protein HRR99_03270 [Agrobacterium vaccinii]
MEVTNNSPATLVLNGKVDGKVKQFSLKPKEKKEFDLLETKANEARIKSGAISVDGERAASKDEPNLDREDLKKQADELGIEYPANVKTAKLKELIDAKLAE